MKTVFYKSIAGSSEKANEDAFLVKDMYAIVLDGATALNGNGNIVEWYTKALLHYLDFYLQQDFSLQEVLHHSIMKVKEEFLNDFQEKLNLEDVPSSCVLLVREQENDIEMLNLGDASILYQTKDGNIHLFNDEPNLENLDISVFHKMEEISKKKNITHLEARQESIIKQMLIDNRKKKNQPNGYYIADIYPEAAFHAATLKIKKEEIDFILLASDGLTEWYTIMEIGSKEQLFSLLLKDGEAVFKALKEAQNQDYLLEKTRFKVSDDMTGVLVKVG